jgi:hypothetical protein
MQSRDFCFWLQGFFELADKQQELTQEQTQIVKNHLDMVFAHEITPNGKLKSEAISTTFGFTQDVNYAINC